MKAVTHLIQQDQPYDWGFMLELGGQPSGSLRVLAFEFTETLSTPYQGNIQVASRNTKINPTDSIGHQVILSIHHKYDANIRYFVGTLKQMVVQDIVEMKRGIDSDFTDSDDSSPITMKTGENP
ncbi:MAG: hypothetical protein L3J00_00245 [Thiomicrorhabdus sp.]|nr:hypothetical protein [Thiomicrorhabdus sp.]